MNSNSASRSSGGDRVYAYLCNCHWLGCRNASPDLYVPHSLQTASGLRNIFKYLRTPTESEVVLEFCPNCNMRSRECGSLCNGYHDARPGEFPSSDQLSNNWYPVMTQEDFARVKWSEKPTEKEIFKGMLLTFQLFLSDIPSNSGRTLFIRYQSR
jgi:hypothetical protein